MILNPTVFLAHSPNQAGNEDYLRNHLLDVANRAAEYATAFNAAEEARLSGLLHDLGKYGRLFQRRLEGKEQGIDHWSQGAWEALTRYKNLGIAAALAIQGHHIGLQKAEKDSLCNLDPTRLSQNHPLGLRLSEADIKLLIQCLRDDGLNLPVVSASIIDSQNHQRMSAAEMLDVRMLYSALVDADFIETEAHFQGTAEYPKCYREPGIELKPNQALEWLLSYIRKLAVSSQASPVVNKLRSDLLNACLETASSPTGLFTLTAPTGTGKTLSMLAFALKRASLQNLRRVITVIPYLSIIEQTVREYRKVLGSWIKTGDLERYILEHHSLAGIHEPVLEGEQDSEDESRRNVRILAENWDAPIIVTTSVQFLESLFSNRPAACRKLHRLAGSVILFDEVQTLPVHLIVPTLATLSRLAQRYGSTIVFSTATQPAFTHLDNAVREYCVNGWKPREIVPQDLKLFDRARRTKIEWPMHGQKISWEELAGQVFEYSQALCIVNLKKHTVLLYDELSKRGTPGLFHMSTNMCPAHRQAALEEVRKKLERREPCTLISTQCVEAGVDVDFPVVFRAFGPLDSIAQAAGRCNRNGLMETGLVYIFTPDDEAYPDSTYRQASGTANILLQKYGTASMDIDSPHLFEEYYRELYSLARPENQNKELLESIKRRDFIEVASMYRVIRKNAINVLVPYNREIFQELAAEVRRTGLNRHWISRARPYAVSLFRPGTNDSVVRYLDPVPVGKNEVSDEWFIYLNEAHYNPDKGLVPPSSLECLIA